MKDHSIGEEIDNKTLNELKGFSKRALDYVEGRKAFEKWAEENKRKFLAKRDLELKEEAKRLVSERD
jgi:hypothetical protein